jgi:hypothetical protein
VALPFSFFEYVGILSEVRFQLERVTLDRHGADSKEPVWHPFFTFGKDAALIIHHTHLR